MKIQFERLGPTETVTYAGKIYKNGDIVEMEDAHAKAYINAKLATEVVDPEKALARIKLETKNAKAREKAKTDAKAKEALDANLQALAGAAGGAR